MKLVKLVPVCLFAIATIGCAGEPDNFQSNEPVGYTKSSMPVRYTKNSDGTCSDQFVSDLIEAQDAMKKILPTLMNTLPEKWDENTKVDPTALQEALQNFVNKVSRLKASYSDYSCLMSIGGKHKSAESLVNSFIAMADKVDSELKKIPALKKTFAERAEECTVEMKADYNDWNSRILPHISAVTAMAKRAISGDSLDQQELKEIESHKGMILLLSNQFRSKHEGDFKCAITNQAGERVIVNSKNLDENLRNLEKQIEGVVNN